MPPQSAQTPAGLSQTPPSSSVTSRLGLVGRVASLVKEPLDALRAVRNRFRREVVPPAVFHITHHKAGSQWVLRILHGLVHERYVQPEVECSHFLNKPLVTSGIYPTVYVTREQFESVQLPKPWKRFVVIRDIRDTLVSLYFSIKHSHPILTDRTLDRRAFYAAMSVEQGLLHLAENRLGGVAQIQWSWLAAGDRLIKYEELLTRDLEILEDVLLKQCQLNVTPERLREVVLANRFEAKAGRKRGEENIKSHERKGVSGDWRNHFTDKIAKAVKERFGSLLIATGYEKTDRW